MNEWTDEHKTILREKWEKGDFARDIGEALGRSKNAVVGQANRMGLPKHPWTLQNKKERAPRKPMTRINARPPKPPQIVAPITFTSSGVSFMDVKADQCRAIIGRDDDRYSLVRFCGAPVRIDESFCPTHCDKFFSPRIGK